MFRTFALSITLCFASCACYAAAATAPIPVEAFFSNNKVSSVQVSPDGKYLAVLVADNASEQGNRFLTILGSGDMKIKTKFQVPEDKVIWHYWWVNDERVLVATSTQTGALSVPTFDGALYGINVDGSQFLQLLGDIPAAPSGKAPIKEVADNFSHIEHKGETKSKHVNHFFDGMLHIPRDDSHHFLVGGWSEDSQHVQVLDVDAYSGDVKVVIESPLDNGDFLTDADGHVRVTWGIKGSDGKPQLFYRDAADGAIWKDLSALYKGLDPADEDTGPLMVAQDGKTFYWRGRTVESTLGLFSVDPVDMSVTTLYADPVFDTGTSIFGDFSSNNHKILAVETEPGLPDLHVIDDKDPETALLQALRQAFPGQEVNITSATRDGASLVLFVASDR